MDDEHEHVDGHEPTATESNGRQEKLEASEGVWVVLKYDGTAGAIGRVHGHKKLNEKIRQQILHGDNKPLALDIAFDYVELFRPVPVMDQRSGQPIMTPMGPQTQMAREPIVTNTGFIFDECMTYARNWVRLNFFDDMKPADRARYVEFRDSAIKGSEERRARELGLIDPNDPRLQRMPDENGKPHFKLDLRQSAGGGPRPPQ